MSQTNPTPEAPRYTGPPTHFAGPSTPATAILGLVLGILGMCTGVTAIFGLLCAILALVKINRHPERFHGRGVAIAGAITSIIGMVVLVGWIAVITLMVRTVNQTLPKIQAMQTAMMAPFKAMELKGAIDQYASNNDDTLPASVGHREAIKSYLTPQSAAFSTPPPMAMNAALSGFAPADNVGKKTVLFFETDKDGPESGGVESVATKPLSDQGLLVVYWSGEIEFVSTAKAKTLKWKPGKGPEDEGDDDDDSMSSTTSDAGGVNADYAAGVANMAANKYPAAIKSFTKFIEESPDDPHLAEARFRLAKCYETMPNPDVDLAIRAWETYLRKHGDDDPARVEAARKRLANLSGQR